MVLIPSLHTTATGLESQDETRGENETPSIKLNQTKLFNLKEWNYTKYVGHFILWTCSDTDETSLRIKRERNWWTDRVRERNCNYNQTDHQVAWCLITHPFSSTRLLTCFLLSFLQYCSSSLYYFPLPVRSSHHHLSDSCCHLCSHL